MAAMPTVSLRRKQRHVGKGAPTRRAMYFATVAWLTWIPFLDSVRSVRLRPHQDAAQLERAPDIGERVTRIRHIVDAIEGPHYVEAVGGGNVFGGDPLEDETIAESRSRGLRSRSRDRSGVNARKRFRLRRNHSRSRISSARMTSRYRTSTSAESRSQVLRPSLSLKPVTPDRRTLQCSTLR
jgi:hypothetical protein